MLNYFTAWVLQWRCSGWNPACTDPSGSLFSAATLPIWNPMFSESVRTCSFHITQKIAPESPVAEKMRQTEFMIASVHHLVSEAAWNTSQVARAPLHLPSSSSRLKPCAAWSLLDWLLLFPLPLLSLWLFWFESRTCLYQQQKRAVTQLSVNQRDVPPLDALSHQGSCPRFPPLLWNW